MVYFWYFERSVPNYGDLILLTIELKTLATYSSSSCLKRLKPIAYIVLQYWRCSNNNYTKPVKTVYGVLIWIIINLSKTSSILELPMLQTMELLTKMMVGSSPSHIMKMLIVASPDRFPEQIRDCELHTHRTRNKSSSTHVVSHRFPW